MKNKILNMLFIFLIIAFLVWLGFYLAGSRSVPENNLNNDEISEQKTSQLDLFESYIKSNISELSPEPAVLGGTFYVTEVRLLSDNLALVNYEDGHIAIQAVALFSVLNDEVIIESFEIVPDELTGGPINQDGDNSICIDQCGNGICEEMVCMGEGCPCPETPESCPVDCA